MWYKVAINGVEGFILVRGGDFVGYYDASGVEIVPTEGTSVHVTENDVVGPFDA